MTDANGATAPETAGDPRRPALALRVLVVAVPVMVAAAICAYQLTLPNALFGVSGYDDGVYFAAVTRFVYGQIPYRDFVFVQPPGIVLLLTPVGLLGRVVSSRDAFAVARCVTGAVAVANVALASLSVRSRGLVASAVAGLALACFPLVVAADYSVMLEPYLLFFCLLGVVLLFANDKLASPRRQLLAGIAFGFAGTVKLWAAAVILAALAVLVARHRAAARRLLLGAVVGFAVPSLPFFVLAPTSFVRDLVVSQVSRGNIAIHDLSIGQRLIDIAGLVGIPGIHATTGPAVTLAAAFVVVVGVAYVADRRNVATLSWFLMLAAVATVLAVDVPTEFYPHYSYFPVVFLALLLGASAGHLVSAVSSLGSLLNRTRAGRHRIRSTRPVWWLSLLVVAVALAVAVAVIPGTFRYSREYFASSIAPSALIDAYIPPDSCIVTDTPAIPIEADRIEPAPAGCPAIVDPFGTWMVNDPKHLPPSLPPFPATFVQLWQSDLGRADYVVIVAPLTDYVPWTPALESWFSDHFRLVAQEPRAYIYESDTSPLTPSASSDLAAAVLAIKIGQLKSAESDLNSTVAMSPDSPVAWFDLGVVAQDGRQDASAAADYVRALALQPTFVSPLYNLAVIDTTSDPSKAIALYERVIRIKPSAASARFNLGLLLVRAGQQAAGLQQLRSAIALDPSLRANLPNDIRLPS